jgi:transposase-like protein
MAGRGRPGAAPDTAKRERYAALIARGVSYAEACRVVGINRRTGKRWRHGRTITSGSGRRLHYAPVVDVKRKREISARFLSEDERVRIADLRRAGEGVRAIAREVGRSPATVSRELRRNADASSGTYRPPAPPRLAERVRLPKGHWQGKRAARDILALAGQGRAFRSLGSLITRQGGPQVLYGSALALAATVQTWASDTATPVPELARTTIH